MKRLFTNKQAAYYFVIDVFIGLFIFVIAILIIASYASFVPPSGAVEQTMDALTQKLFRLPLTKTDPGNVLLQDFKMNHSLYNPTFTIDEFIYVLVNHSEEQNASLLLQNLTLWVPANVGFNYTLNGHEIYSKQASIHSLEESVVKLTRKKLTLVAANLTTAYELGVTTLVVWQ